MYERLLAALLAHPGALTVAGRGLFFLAGAMALLGLRFSRLGRRVTRVFERYGVEPPDLMGGLPWWLRMLVPETAPGWIGVFLMLAAGVLLVYAGKQLKKLQS